MPGSDLRIQMSLDSRYQDFPGRARVTKVLGEQVPVAALEDVVQGKVWAWSDVRRRASKRKKDELDLMRILENYPETRDLMPKEIRDQI
jgi:predicted nucleotidyltransferase